MIFFGTFIIYVCVVCVCGRVIGIFVMEEFEENDISWLTQVPKLDQDDPNFNVGFKFIEEDLCLDKSGKNVVSLEEVETSVTKSNGRILYDNVMVEDISSDEELDSM